MSHRLPVQCPVCSRASVEPFYPYCGADHQATGTAQRRQQRKDYEQTAQGEWRTYKKLYNSAAWKGVNGVRRVMLRCNPVCQRIKPDGQCHEASTQVHHLRAHHGDAKLFMDFGNLLALCDNCHPGGQAGTPEWIAGRDFVVTKAPRWSV